MTGYYTNPTATTAGVTPIPGTVPGYIPGVTPTQLPPFVPGANGQFYYGGQNVTPIVNGVWNQAASQFGYQASTPTIFNINGGGVPTGSNPLTDEDLKLLAAVKKKPFEISPERSARAKCTHKAPAGKPNAGQIDGYSKDGGETWHCNVCQSDFKVVDKSVEEIEALVQYLMDVFDTIKLMWLNVPPQIIQGMYSAIPILELVGEAYKAAKADWESANNQGKVYQTGSVYTNPGYGANSYVPMPTQYATPPAYPYGYQIPGAGVSPYSAYPGYTGVTNAVDYSGVLQNNPLVPSTQPVAPPTGVVTPTIPTPTPPANPYAQPVVPPVATTPTTPTPTATPPVGSGVVTTPPDPINMKTTSTGQTI